MLPSNSDNDFDYKTLFQHVPNAYLILTPNLTIVEVSDAYLKATMTKRRQIMGRKLFEVFPDNPEDQDASGTRHLSASLNRVIQDGVTDKMAVQKYDIRKPLEEGGEFEERYWSPLNSPVFDAQGKLRYIIHSVEDVTELVKLHQIVDEQRQIPAELRTSEADLAAVMVDEMYQFVALLDKDGRLLEVNRTTLQGTGLRRSEVRGEYLWEVPMWKVTPENFIKIREASLRACRGEFVQEELLLFAAAAGKEAVTVDFSIKPIRDQKGKMLFLLAEGRNITERKLAEAEIERKSAELQSANDKLLEADRLKTEFFANVSHELRTPLALIIGPVQKLLADKELSAEKRKDLSLVERNARFLLKHVNDLLDMSRLEAGAMKLNYAETDVAWLARFVASFFENLAADKQMRFNVEIAEKIPAEVDVEKTERVLLNLLSNAFKFTPVGGAISLAVTQNKNDLTIVVQDNGPGIPESMSTAVFERFRQVEGSSSRRFGGTGLGLSIVKEFVELQNGTVALENVPGQGLRVAASIPLKAPPGVQVQPFAVPSEEKASTYVEELNNGRSSHPTKEIDEKLTNAPLILIVEDNQDVRTFLSDILSVDYRTVTAQNGEEGLQKALTYAPSLIVADVMMPQMSGEEMVRALRRKKGFSDTPVLMLTARVDEELRLRMLERGVQDFLTKPFSPREMLARVSRLIEERKNAAETLKISEDRYRSLIEATTSVVWTTNVKGQIDVPQEAWENYTGQTETEAKDLGWMNAFHPDDREQINQIWDEAIRYGAPFEAEGRIWSVQHAMYRYFVGHGIALKNRDGSLREWIVTAYDMHERTTMEQRLRVSVKEKETLLQEMHHRVKNNMQVISSMLGLQARSVEEKKMQAILEESQHRIRAMALVHERLYKSHTLSKVDFGEYLGMLANELFSSSAFNDNNQVSLDLAIEPVDLDISKAVPCGLLVNELISNSLKHAFPDGRKGVIRIFLAHSEPSRVKLCVEDNGVGLPPHTNVETTRSLGLQIVRTLARQLGGELKYETGSGLKCTVEFKAAASDEDRLQGITTDLPPASPN